MSAIRALKGKVIATAMKRGERLVRGILLKNDDGKEHGVRPRWCKVLSVGDDIDYIDPGQWIYVEHGRWSRTFKLPGYVNADETPMDLFEVEASSVMLVSDEEPSDDMVKDTYVYGGPSKFM